MEFEPLLILFVEFSLLNLIGFEKSIDGYEIFYCDSDFELLEGGFDIFINFYKI